jgi:N-acetylmuramoyl-L-alanine amidase
VPRFPILLPLLFSLLVGCRPAPRHAHLVLAEPLRGVTVILDPGHGGTDSGARRSGLREDTINYRVASVVGTILEARGAKVVFTVRSAALVPGLREDAPEPPLDRPADATLVYNRAPVRLRADSSPDDLYRRAAIAAAQYRARTVAARRTGRGLYFLALHCDELGNSPGRGARVYFDRRGGVPSRFATVLKRRLTRAGLTNSPNGEVIPRHYGVLNPRYNPVPESVLLEALTLSSPADRKSALDPHWRWRLARLIADTIAECEKP